ncbi:peptidase M23 [Flavobacterium psychrophilum]|nr:peptidase M23 [Flavobacterium psychrophilum]
MKKIITLLVIALLIISCKKDNENLVLPTKKAAPIRYEFGFRLNDFFVVNDTIKSGDTFGSIIKNKT